MIRFARRFSIWAILLLAALPCFAAATRTEMVASAAFTASGNSAAFSMSTATSIVVGIDVTAASGTTPVLDLWLQASDDGGTTWYDMPADWALKTATTAAAGTLTPSSGAGVRDIVDGNATTGAFLGVYKHLATDKIRLKWVISGTTPSFTFSASVVAK